MKAGRGVRGGRQRRVLAIGIAVAATVGIVRSLPAAGGAAAARVTPPGMTTLLDSGAWSWFEDERVIVDAAGRRLYVSAVVTAPTPGEVVLGEIDLTNGARREVGLGVGELDDHDSAAIWESPRREVVTAWTRHAADKVIRTHRRRTNGTWLRLPPVTDSSTVTYNNLYSVLAADGPALLYDFYRGSRIDPQAMASADAGRTWSTLGSLLRDPADSPTTRPYVRYTSRGDRIDLIATEAHPGTAVTSIYHGFIRDGILHTSSGTPLGPVGSGVVVTSLTRISAPNPTFPSWTVDIGYDARNGNPIAAFSTRVSPRDHRYHIARWTGSAWEEQEIAHGGQALYPGQPDYAGLLALDPSDPDHVVISTDADPTTGAPLVSATDAVRHFEIFDGRRGADGRYAWTPLTANSTQDNIRPVIAAGATGEWALAWLRGVYDSYSNFHMKVVGVIRRSDGSHLGTRPTGARLPVIPGIAPPPNLSSAALPLAGNFDNFPASDLFLYRAGTGRDDLIIGDDGRHPVYAQAPGVKGTYRPVAGDFDGDGDTDIFWYAPGPSPDSIWTATGDGRFTSRAVAVNGLYLPIPGDFDGDGDTDIFWYAPGTAQDSLWLARDGAFTPRRVPPVNGSYIPIPGDFDGDGDTDIFWYAAGTTADHLWTAEGGVFTARPSRSVNGTYTPIPGDFDHSGTDDIMWYAPGTATDVLWAATAGTFVNRPIPQVTGRYIPASGDFDGDGADDIVWYAPGTATDYVWWSAPEGSFPLSQLSSLAM